MLRMVPSLRNPIDARIIAQSGCESEACGFRRAGYWSKAASGGWHLSSVWWSFLYTMNMQAPSLSLPPTMPSVGSSVTQITIAQSWRKHTIQDASTSYRWSWDPAFASPQGEALWPHYVSLHDTRSPTFILAALYTPIGSQYPGLQIPTRNLNFSNLSTLLKPLHFAWQMVQHSRISTHPSDLVPTSLLC